MWRASQRWAPFAAAAALPLLPKAPARAEAADDKMHRSTLLERETSIKRRDVRSAPTRMRNIVSDEHRRDGLIQWLKTMMHHSFVLGMPGTYAGTWQTFEDMVEEHRARSHTGKSRLQQMVPSVGTFHTPLPVTRAWRDYDSKYCTSRRKYVPPTFNEIRHILNLAQLMALAADLKVISFDGDQTLYSDGQNFESDDLAALLIGLLKDGVTVVVMTAAGYGWDGPKYEHRLAGLLKHFKANLTPQEMSNFIVVGGECNYMMVANAEARLERLPDDRIAPLSCNQPLTWEQHEVDRMLDLAETCIVNAIEEMHLRARIIRKPRSVGVIPGGEAGKLAQPHGHGSLKLKYEALDEIALRVEDEIAAANPPFLLPYCSFNGGRDAWIDVGTKGIGMEVMQAMLDIPAAQSLHVGDQFLRTGNDIAARHVAPCCWITSPAETTKILSHLCKYRRIRVPDLGSAPKVQGDSGFDVYTGLSK